MQDGAEWLQGLVDVLRLDAVRILHFLLALEHLTTAAQPVLGTATPELKAWLDKQAHTLKHAADSVRQVLTDLVRCRSTLLLIRLLQLKRGIAR